MNTNYNNSVKYPLQVRKDPIEEEMMKKVGTFNLVVTVEKDVQTLAQYKHIPNMVAFITKISKDNQLIGVGRSTAVLNRLNKFIERTVIFALNASFVDGMVRAARNLDALSIMSVSQKGSSEGDLEGKDKQSFFADEDLPAIATEKQKSFLMKLINSKCDDDSKGEYLTQLESPYLSKFQCSELINSLLPKDY